MAELNRAYSSGDQERLRKLSNELRVSPDAVTGGTIGDELVRAIRQISQIRNRIAEIDVEKRRAVESELYSLHEKARAEADAGRDTLKQMAERARTHIAKSRRRLENLKTVNQSQEEYVKEEFGMDISDFRP
jgi:hypothetical protein